MSIFDQMQQALLGSRLQLLAKANVVGVGIGFIDDDDGQPTDEIGIVTLVEQKKPAAALSADDMVPSEVDGAKTDVVEVGILRAFNSPSPRGRFRPVIPPGVSIAHFQVTAGTFGTLVYDTQTGEPLILSNNHVIANSNDANLGDAIFQPGPADGGQNPADAVATLYKYMPLRYTDEGNLPPPTVIGPPGGVTPPPDPDPNPDPNPDPTPPPSTNGCAQLILSLAEGLARLNDPDARVVVQSQATQTAEVDGPVAVPVFSANSSTVQAQQAIPTNSIDAALAKPNSPAMFSNEIRSIGAVTGVRNGGLGMQVRKSGRTTDFTTGTITLVNATIDVGYSTINGTRTARFTGQTMTTAMSQGGDSGSLVVAADSQDAIGLLFAGSPQATIITPIDLVLNTLGVRLTP